MSDWHARPDLIELADKINEIQLQRSNGVEFLSRPRTYSTGDLPACWVCHVAPERIRVGRPDEVVDFSGPRITVTCEPCGHHMSISPDEASLVLEHGRQKRQSDVQDPVSLVQRERPRASVIEIIAKDYKPTEDGPGSMIVPREVRINGVSVYTASGDDGVKISDIRLGDDTVTVNLTLIARKLVIAADGDLDEETS